MQTVDTSILDQPSPTPGRRRWIKPALAAAVVIVVVALTVILSSGDQPPVIEEPTTTSVPSTTSTSTTTTTASTTVPIAPADALIGTWSSPWGRLELREDLTFSFTDSAGVGTDEGTYRLFEPTSQLTFVSLAESERCASASGTFNFTIRDTGDVALVLGSDGCDSRALSLDGSLLQPVEAP
jgi:hypothetical protein